MKRALLLLCLLAPSLAHAETAYVTERLVVPLYPGPSEGPVLRTIEAGSTLEVLERRERFARVRDAQGQDGWIEVRFLATVPPARLRAGRLEEEANQLRAALGDAQARLKTAQEALAKQGTTASAAAPATPADKPTVGSDKPAQTKPAATDGGSAWGWMVLAFAMLVVGFVAGYFWLRESIRRRSGGMYLRI